MIIKELAICAYRDWALKTYDSLVELFPDIRFILIDTPQKFLELASSKNLPKLIFCIGWSSIIKDEFLKEKIILGLHPSDLPSFSGGSPIQHQILNGVLNSKMTLFKLSKELDSGPIISKLPLSLEGHIDDIFKRLQLTSTILLRDYLNNYPNNIYQESKPLKKCLKRLKPDDSEISKEQFCNLSAKEIFDMIRCREDPYPNCFLKDNSGKLIFKLCEFEENL